MRNKAIRKAILIGAPGGQESTYLPGVRKDLGDLKDHLCSIRGGLWCEDEILILNNPSAEQALSIIQSTKAEYLLVYFSGHGFTDVETAARLLCFKNHAFVSDIALTQTISPRLMLVSDACRNYHGEGISGIPLPRPDYFDYSGETNEIRYLFDQAILDSPHGKIIIHGTAENQYAMDSKNGGYFTQALLHIAGRMNIPIGHELVSMEQVLYHVPSVLEQRGNGQEPEIFYISGELTVPFAVAMPIHETSSTPSAPPVQISETTSSPNSGGGLLLGLGMVALALYLSD